MLRTLHIRDYALIDALDVAFDSGLNVITGETGAGKSILLGALSMILGERASTEVVRTGAKKAVIEGTFDEAGTPTLRALLEAHGYEAGTEILLRREISASQSRAFVNDSPCPVGFLKEVASHLIDLHGQHEHQSLLRVDTHLGLLDAFGGLGALLAAYQKAYAEVETLVRERKTLVARERELRQQKELYAFQIEEIDRIAPKPGEEIALEAERRVLENAERLHDATQTLYEALYEGEDTVHDRLVVVRNELQDLARIDTAFDDPFAEMKAAVVSIAEIATFLQDYNARVEFDPQRLDDIRVRAAELDLLKRKYGATLDDVLAHRRDIGAAFDLATDFEGAIARLTERAVAAQRTLTTAAQRLSTKRREVAAKIERLIEAELQALGMPHARFVVDFDHKPDPHGWIRLQDGNAETRYAAFETGMDVVEFFLSTNLGEDAKPLARVASGGEVSRVMLAIKTVLAKHERMPILVFDEIDTGISGGVARKVGEAMHSLAQYHQIVAITHLPQIAALGDTHFFVEKVEAAGRTHSTLRRLSEDERVEAVASLLSGEMLTDAARESARELMTK